MSEVVNLSGEPVEAQIPDGDTCEAVLGKLIEEIRAGHLKPLRLVCVVEHDADTRFFTRSSRMMNSEAIAMLAVGGRLVMDSLFGEG